MLHSLKKFLSACLLTAGIEVRIASRITGVNPLNDIRKFHRGPVVKTVFDIGANIGQSALRFNKAFPEATIHSFEPVIRSYEAGLKNTTEYASIVWHHLALGNNPESIVFYSSGMDQTNSIKNTTISRGTKRGDRNAVDLVRLDDFVANNRITHIDLLKTDTEGLDIAVLEGAESLLRDGGVSYILSEVGFCEADKVHSFFPSIAGYLELFGYRLVCFYGISDIEHFRGWGVTYADALFAKPQRR